MILGYSWANDPQFIRQMQEPAPAYWVEVERDAVNHRWINWYVVYRGSFRTSQEAIEAAIVILRQVRNY